LKQKLNQEKVMALNLDEECTFMPNLQRSQQKLSRYRSAQKLGGEYDDLPNQNIGGELRLANQKDSFARNEQAPGGKGKKLGDANKATVWERMDQRI
jgi:hypothetical protein